MGDTDTADQVVDEVTKLRAEATAVVQQLRGELNEALGEVGRLHMLFSRASQENDVLRQRLAQLESNHSGEDSSN